MGREAGITPTGTGDMDLTRPPGAGLLPEPPWPGNEAAPVEGPCPKGTAAAAAALG